jgi:acetyltransferase-like isoleucine patch superfamily enzyme
VADRDLTVHASPGERNALWYWAREVGVLKVVKNYLLVALARVSPSLRLKNWLYRRMGIDVGDHASVGLEATMDVFFPELITIGEDTIVGFDSVILCHEFLVDEYRTGPVEIGDEVSIGANVTILPGVEIGDGATVSAHSLVNSDVPAGAFYGGVPARDLEGAQAPPSPSGKTPE